MVNDLSLMHEAYNSYNSTYHDGSPALDTSSSVDRTQKTNSERKDQSRYLSNDEEANKGPSNIAGYGGLAPNTTFVRKR